MKNLTLIGICLFIHLAGFGQAVRPALPALPCPAQSGQAKSVRPDIHTVKGGGDIFWTEDFDWADPNSGIGWLLPADWSLQDPLDIGYNWHWANSNLVGPYTDEPPLGSTTQSNGFLALNLAGYNSDFASYNDFTAVNNSITSPVIDCSAHPSVLVRIEQNFRYWADAIMLFEVTSDAGAHWASYDMEMGTLISERVGGISSGQKVDLNLNITDVAANQPNVQFRITWRDSKLYYWMIDDITFMEGWDNDLQLLHYQADYDNGQDTEEGFFYALPKTQISGYNFSGIIKNFGNLEQWGTEFNVQVTKNNQIVYNQSSTPYTQYPGYTDTLEIEQQYTPEDFGHYRIDFTARAETPDDIPGDNSGSAVFHVTDSLFSRCDDEPEITFSSWEWYTVPHEGDQFGVWYTIVNDIEINSISAYISSADIQSTFRFILFRYDAETDSPYLLLESDMIEMDSTILHNHWVTLPLTKDGEGEFLQAGETYMAAIEFWNNMEFEEAYDSKRYYIGSDRTNFLPGQSWYYFTNDQAWYSTGDDLFMIRMNLNDHTNLIDGIPETDMAVSELNQNYPNPFGEQTHITFELGKPSAVEMLIQDISGRIIRRIDLGNRMAGMNEIILEGTSLEPGHYFYTLRSDSFTQTKRMTVIR